MTSRALALLALAGALAGCASGGAGDDAFAPATPPAASQHFRVTPPGQVPMDVYFAAWGEGYVIYAPGIAPIYLLSDKKGGYVLQRPGESASFVIPMKDANGWNVLQANAPATIFMKNPNGTGWILLPPGELPTLVVPDPQ
jgi:hypothetical protein